MAAHQKFNSLISIFLITLINPLKKNNLGAKVSVTQDWRLHPPSAVQGSRERKDITQHGTVPGNSQLFPNSQHKYMAYITIYYE